jgi:hypothetical protein
MRYRVGRRPAITQQDRDYPYYVTIEGLSSIYNWREPAKTLNIQSIHDYVKFLKDNYDVSIRLNWGPRYERMLGLHIDFKHQEQAEQLTKICNGER